MKYKITFNGQAYCEISNSLPIFCIAGPCAIESRSHALETAFALKEIFSASGIPLIYKSSYDKANRSSCRSYRGPRLNEGLKILQDVREIVGLPILTDIHLPQEAEPVAEVADFIQTPAFLCRQTDLIQAATATGKPINIKKGQFLAPWEMANILQKAYDTQPDKENVPICLCERGSMFGYNNLVVDMRSLAIMKKTGAPIIFDATHSVQLPGKGLDKSEGEREFVETLARAAVAIGIAGLFIETHPDPDNAPCDGPNMLPISELPHFLEIIRQYDQLTKSLFNKNEKPLFSQASPQHIYRKPDLARIRMLISDIDGIWTDGGLFYNEDGESLKKFNARDGMGLRRLSEAGISVAVLSGRGGKALKARLKELNIDIFLLNQNDKNSAFQQLMKTMGLKADEIAYVGDDFPDSEIFACCGASFTVCDAHKEVRKKADFVLESAGGTGAIGEIAQLLLSARRN